jgi:YVTN family beta-propeller protein
VTRSNDDAVTVIGTDSDTVLAVVLVGGGPRNVTVASDGRVYVTNSSLDGDVYMINLQGSDALFHVGGDLGPLAASPNGRFVYVVDHSSETVAVIDEMYGSVLARITVGVAPQGVAFSPDGSRVYVTNSDGTLSIIRVEPISVPEAQAALST